MVNGGGVERSNKFKVDQWFPPDQQNLQIILKAVTIAGIFVLQPTWVQSYLDGRKFLYVEHFSPSS